MKCPECGLVITYDLPDCPACGASLKQEESLSRKIGAFFARQEERALLLGVIFAFFSLVFWSPLGEIGLARSYSGTAATTPLNAVLLGAGGIIILVSLIALLVRKVWYKE